MAEDVAHIRRFVASLIRRERGLLAARVVARAAGLGVALLLAMVLAAVVRLDRGTASLVAVALAGVGGWVAVAWPLLVEWRSAGDPQRQARRVEALRPELRGRLITAVDRVEGAAVGESDALLALLLRRALGALKGLPAAEVHPARPALRAMGLASLAWAVGLIALLAAPGGPLGVARFWFGGGAARAEMAALSLSEAEETARVGDLVLRYTYPDYTGLEPKTIPNSTGDVQGPPGTVVEVTARSADPVEAAGLLAYDERLEAQVGEDRRTVVGRFTIAPVEGQWRLELFRDGAAERSRPFAVVPESDLAPDVTVEVVGEEPLQVAADQPILLGWRARDDYGIRKVSLAIDGRERDEVLARPDRRRAEVDGEVRTTPRELGLGPGARVKLSVVAWDNDTVGGSKRGASREIELVVLGARGLDQRQAERREELLALMIPILARQLTDPWPPGDTSGELAAWGETVAGRYQPLAEAVERLWSGMSAESQDRKVVGRVLDTGRGLVRFTQVSFVPGATDVPGRDAVQMTSKLRDEAIVALEDGILAFHALKRNRALAALEEQADDLEKVAAQLEELLASEDPDAQEMLARLDQLERQMEALAREAAKLDESGLREFVNLRENEARNLMDEIRKAISEGRMEDARKMMERLSQLVKETGEGIREELNRRGQEADDAQQDADELKAELEALEQEQRALQQEVQALREQDRDGADRMAALWAELEKRAGEHRRAADAWVKGLEDAQRAFWERERGQAAADEAADLESAIAARDVRGARASTDRGEGNWGLVRRALDTELDRRGAVPGPGRRELGALLQQLQQIRDLLDRLEQAERQVDPETLERSREQEGRQRDLDNRLQQARERAEALEQQFPVRPEGMQEALQEAQERMGQAAEDLQQGQSMQAEGSQGVAAQRIRDAIEALEQAQQQAQQQAQEMQGGGGEPQDGEQQAGKEQDGRDPDHRPDLDIPGREEFRTPEEYRRALLEGMEGDVPEEYRAMKRRYYEELVAQ